MKHEEPLSNLQLLWEQYLDGALSKEAAQEIEQALVEDEAFRAWVRDDLVLGHSLQHHLADMDLLATERGPMAPASQNLKIEGRAPSTSRFRFAAISAAAAALFAAGLWIGTQQAQSTASPAGPDAPQLAVAENPSQATGPINLSETKSLSAPFNDTDPATLARMSSGTAISLLPGSACHVESDTSGAEVVVLDRGALNATSSTNDSPFVLKTAEIGTAYLSGMARFDLVPPTEVSQGYLMVQVDRGIVKLRDGDYEDELVPGEPYIVYPSGPRLLTAMLERLSDLQGDEGMRVMTTADYTELMANLDTEKEELQQRVGSLVAQNERLTLKIEAMEAQEDHKGPTLNELLQATATRLEQDSPKHPGPHPRHRHAPEFWRAVHALTRDHRNNPEALVTAVKASLLMPDATPTHQRLGLAILSKLRHSSVIDLLKPFLNHDSEALRLVALRSLAHQRGAQVVELLRKTFNGATDFETKLRAAEGLLQNDERGQPLKWLKDEFAKRDPTDHHARIKILGRLLQIPLEESGAKEDVLAICMDPATPRHAQRGLLHFLSRIGSDESYEVLSKVALDGPSPQIRAFAEHLLSR